MRISDWSSDVCSSDLFEGADMSTKLKLLGVDVASFGDAFATTPGALELVFADAVGGVYKKLVVLEKDEPEGGFVLLGGILVGDASAYGISSEARRVGKERVGTCRSRWSPYN